MILQHQIVNKLKAITLVILLMRNLRNIIVIREVVIIKKLKRKKNLLRNEKNKLKLFLYFYNNLIYTYYNLN